MVMQNMSMTESTTKNVEKRRVEITPRYNAWIEGSKLFIQVVIPGVKKEDISLKALEDRFVLTASRDQSVEYHLDLELNFKIEPTKVKSQYHEGLLKVEFERYNALEHAFTVPIN